MSNGVSLHVLQHECKIMQICCTFTCDQSHKEKWIYFWKQFDYYVFCVAKFQSIHSHVAKKLTKHRDLDLGQK